MYRSRNHFTLTKAGNGVWYYYAYDDSGKRIRRSTGQTLRRLALDEVHRRIDSGTLLQKAEDICISKPMTFREFAEPFWVWNTCPIVQDKIARGGHYSPDLCSSNRFSMMKHIMPYFGDTMITGISRKAVDSWILKLPKEHGISASTANKMLSLLKQMLRVAVYDGLIPISPAESVRPLAEEERRRDAFTEDEVKAMFSVRWPSDTAYAACFLSAFTGMRLGEIRALRASRVHEDYILVDSSWSDSSGLKTTKSGKPRIVPITKRISSMLIKIGNGRVGDELIFSGNGSTPLEDRSITSPMKAIMEKLDIGADGRMLTFHSFRHFFNTQIVAAGISGDIVRNVVGHGSEAMTDRYLHLGAEELGPVKDVQTRLARDIRRGQDIGKTPLPSLTEGKGGL